MRWKQEILGRVQAQARVGRCLLAIGRWPRVARKAKRGRGLRAQIAALQHMRVRAANVATAAAVVVLAVHDRSKLPQICHQLNRLGPRQRQMLDAQRVLELAPAVAAPALLEKVESTRLLAHRARVLSALGRARGLGAQGSHDRCSFKKHKR